MNEIKEMELTQERIMQEFKKHPGFQIFMDAVNEAIKNEEEMLQLAIDDATSRYRDNQIEIVARAAKIKGLKEIKYIINSLIK